MFMMVVLSLPALLPVLLLLHHLHLLTLLVFANVDYSLDGNYCKYIDGQYVACADQGIFIVESSRLVSSGTDTLTPVYRLRQDISLDSAVTKHRFIEAPQNHLTSVVFDSATAGI